MIALLPHALKPKIVMHGKELNILPRYWINQLYTLELNNAFDYSRQLGLSKVSFQRFEIVVRGLRIDTEV